MIGNSGSTYLTLGAQQQTVRGSRGKIVAAIFSIFTVFAILLTPFASVVLPTAHADDKQVLSDSANKAKINTGETGLEQAAKKAPEASAKDETSFYYILNRIFDTAYINAVPLASGGGDNNKKHGGWVCHLNDKYAGNLLYSNCDIPNITTDFLQRMMQTLAPMGLTGATVQSAVSGDGFGVPSVIPGKIVPLNYASQGMKYTGLEIIGYNMHYTSYRGEWDEIQVSNSIRTLSNFGLMDNFTLGIKSILNGFAASAGAAGDTAIDAFTHPSKVMGDLGNIFSSGASSTINTIIDTSDLNVFNNYGWYRVNYGGTLYNARELTQEELSASMLGGLNAAFQAKAVAANTPADLKALSTPPVPAETSPTCTDPTTGKDIKTASGTGTYTQKECTALKGKYNPKGNKAQSIADWKKANTKTLATANSYGITCDMDAKAGDASDKARTAAIDTFKACWAKAYPDAVNKATKGLQTKKNNQSVDSILSNLMNFFGTDHKRGNYLAPYNRYVCTNPDGTDMTPAGATKNSASDSKFVSSDGASYVFLYSTDGEVNPKCGKVRAPIQNGYFGNGYGQNNDGVIDLKVKVPGVKSKIVTSPDQGKVVPVDTRNSIFEHTGALSLLVDAKGNGTTVANIVLSATETVTKVTNTIVDYSFSPILDKLGVKEKFIHYIEAFRDSVYFGLISLVIAFSALTILVNALRTQNPGRGLRDLLIMALTFFLGVIMLFSPATMFEAVDTIPSEIETTIAGIIFQTGNNTQQDALCNASGGSGTTAKAENNVSSSMLAFAPSDSVRTMECEIWQAFSFNPYVFGQWGTGYNNLFSNNSGVATHLTNTNGDLVGSGTVPMGAGVNLRNWAFYQARTLSSGTSTTQWNAVATKGQTGEDFAAQQATIESNVVPRDMYRLVDLQGGINNGQGTDGRYFKYWSGNSQISRIFITGESFLASIFGLITIGSYAIAKIELTLMSLFMLLGTPFILLIGLHPGFGRVKLKQYFGSIVSLMMQRVFLVSFLAIMLRVIVSISNSSNNYFMAGFVTMGICALFFMQRKALLKMLSGDIEKAFGGSMIDTNKHAHKHVIDNLPRSAQNFYARRTSGLRGRIEGGAAGFVVNGVGGIGPGMDRNEKLEKNRSLRKQRRGGFGALYQLDMSADAGREVVRKRYRGSEEYNSVNKKLNNAIIARAKGIDYEFDNVTQQSGKKAFDEEGNQIFASDLDLPKVNMDVNDRKDLSMLSRIDELTQEIESIRNGVDSKKTVRMRKRFDDIDEKRKIDDTNEDGYIIDPDTGARIAADDRNASRIVRNRKGRDVTSNEIDNEISQNKKVHDVSQQELKELLAEREQIFNELVDRKLNQALRPTNRETFTKELDAMRYNFKESIEIILPIYGEEELRKKRAAREEDEIAKENNEETEDDRGEWA